MTNWNFKTKYTPQDISKKIESAFDSVNGLVFNMHNDKNNSVIFKIRKRILYPWYLFYQNTDVVKGKISITKTENETQVEISFLPHFLLILVISVHIVIGLAMLIAIDNNNFMTDTAIVILLIGFTLWTALNKKHKRNVQEYKTLISQKLNA